MTVTTSALRGFSPSKSDQLSQVDYRLARNAIVRNFHNGRLSRLDVCDAHPELIRVAANTSQPSGEICPICEEANVVLVTYAFGTGLGPGGHCVKSKADLTKLARRTTELTCYVVEVCAECSWNHLAQAFKVAGRRRRASS